MRSNDGVNGWENRKELVADVFRKYSPDIVGTQEGYWPQIEQLQKMLPEFGFVGVGRDDGERDGETCAIFYKKSLVSLLESGTFWFSDTPNAPGSRHAECSHARVCTWSMFTIEKRQRITVYNVHLDHESQSAREQSVEMLLARLQSTRLTHPSVILGDFNMTPNNPALHEMAGNTSAPFTDSFGLLHPDRMQEGTFHDFTGRTDGDHIDYIFTSRNIQVVESEIIRDSFHGRYPSDHFPIIARLMV